MKAPFYRVRPTPAETAVVREVMTSGALSRGPHIEQLEDRLKGRFGRRHAIATASGGAAVQLCLLRLARPGAQVLIPAASSCATIPNAVRAADARPVYVDLNIETGGLDARDLPPGGHAASVMVATHHFGVLPAGASPQASGPIQIEDACQSLFSRWRAPKTRADAVVLSFGPTKGVSSPGGGAILTDDDELAELARFLMDPDNRVETPLLAGAPISNLAAAMVLASLDELPARAAALEATAAGYDAALSGAGARVRLLTTPGAVRQRAVLKFEQARERELWASCPPP